MIDDRVCVRKILFIKISQSIKVLQHEQNKVYTAAY